jgi:hypothetical protein
LRCAGAAFVQVVHVVIAADSDENVWFPGEFFFGTRNKLASFGFYEKTYWG